MKRAALIPRFARSEDGGALVEFGLMLPVMLLLLSLIVEGGRTFFSYQTAVTGLRDATRYLSRVMPSDACRGGGSDASAWNARLTRILRESQSGEALFPAGVTIETVNATLNCAAGGYRNGAAPVATVTATLRITFPFAGIAAIAGLDLEPVTTRISDQARIVGA